MTAEALAYADRDLAAPETEGAPKTIPTLAEMGERTLAVYAREQLVALVEAIDAYTGRGGSWDDVLYHTELAKVLLWPGGG